MSTGIGVVSPVVAETGLSNTGTGEVILGSTLEVDGSSVFNSAPAAMSPELYVEITGTGSYQVKNAASGAVQWGGTFTPGQPFEPFSSDPLDSTYTGFTATLSGVPSTGDTFTFNFNAGGTGDNRNAKHSRTSKPPRG